MSPGQRLALVALVILALAAGPALPGVPASDGGAISRRGTYEGGQYLIEVPAGWNGGLVLFAHGYDGGTFVSPLTSYLHDRGYALAASSFSCPLAWSGVTARLDPARFTMTTLPTRFDKIADPLTPVLTGGIDMAAAVARIEQRLGTEQGDQVNHQRKRTNA